MEWFKSENESKTETTDLEAGASKRNIDHVDLLDHQNFNIHSKKIRYK